MTIDAVAASYEAKRSALQAIVERIHASFTPQLQMPHTQRAYAELNTDLRSDFFTVVVLGEFKRGKSTLINALLGTTLLPVGVTPTTATIHALRYGEPEIVVHARNGERHKLPFEESSLTRFVADIDFDPNSVGYIEIALPAPMLRNRVILVDTPGVDDLSKHRAEITCRFIPRADAVLFLLDATSPVKRTERTFLQDEILTAGIDRIIFVANFLDEVDPEEREGLALSIRNRISAAIERPVEEVFLLSAAQALEARQTGDEALLAESGLPALQAALDASLGGSERGQTKLNRYVLRTLALTHEIQQDLEERMLLKQASLEDLQEKLSKLEEAKAKGVQRLQQLDDYVHDRSSEILAMIRKSLHHFAETLYEDVVVSVNEYHGTEFKKFIEVQMPNLVKRRMRAWAETAGDAMETLLTNLEHELAAALAREFRTAKQSLGAMRSQSDEMHGDLSVNARDISNTALSAGLVAGGVGVATMFIAGPLMPLVGLVVFPFLHKSMLDQSLKAAKAEVLPQLERALVDILNRFEGSVTTTIRKNIDRIHEAARTRLSTLLDDFETRIADEMALRTASSHEIERETRALQEGLALLKQLENEIAELAAGQLTLELEASG